MPQSRILIIDDDAEWIEILSGLLAPFEEQDVLIDSASSRPWTSSSTATWIVQKESKKKR
jgi:hypothetical protein